LPADKSTGMGQPDSRQLTLANPKDDIQIEIVNAEVVQR
jgi:hypothetical protein